MLKLWKTPVSHEDAFLERYERLLAWSQQLCGGDHQRAEDVVHDTFVQFVLRRPPLHAIENLDAYLYTMLKNTHLSQSRRASHDPNRHLSLVEYDSAEIGLRVVDPYAHVQAQEELRRICEYAILRKETSKAGSVLILRFFHGYYPSEIAGMLRATRPAVDKWLQIARAEARLYINDRASLVFMRDCQPVDLSRIDFGRNVIDFLRALREAIFRSRRGECPTPEDINQTYRADTGGTIDSDHLTHTVSCAHCMNSINQLLGIPLLSQRSAVDNIGPKTPPKSGPPGGGPSGTVSSDDAATKCLRRIKETIEHKPKELRVAANGYFLASHKIRSELSEQDLSLNVGESIGFVEVFSEQGIRLLLFDVEPPPEGAFDQTALVQFADGRSLETKVSFNNPWPTLRLVYADPTFSETEILNLAALESEADELTSQSTLPSEDKTSSSKIRGLLIRSATCFKQRVLSTRLWLRPATVTVLFAVALLATLLFLKTHKPVRPLIAADLLSQSAQAEDAIAASPDQVLHRTINFEEKRPDGVLISRRRIEVWQSAAQGVTARRLYDEQNKLVAGDWRRRDGVETLYHHGAGPQIQLAPEKGGSLPLTFENTWQLSPSAKDFSPLIGTGATTRVEERGNLYVISAVSVPPASAGGSSVFSSATTSAPSAIKSATLILNKADLHPIELILVINQGSETREYRFVETAFERRAPDAVSPAMFEPEPELLSERMKDEGGRMKESTDSNTLPPTLNTPVAAATADLEVEVLRLLHEARADLGEQISTTKAADGLLHVTGLVDSAERKTEIMRALQPVANNPAVRIELQTIAEAVAKEQKQRSRSKATPAPVIEQNLDIGSGTIATASDLRRHFSSDEQLREFSARMVSQSRSAMDHVYAMKRLVAQFSPEELRTLSPEAKNKWLSLIHSHALAYQTQMQKIRGDLRPIFFPGATEGASERGVEITDDASLIRAVGQVFNLAAANDAVIRSAFVTSSGYSATSQIGSAQFWRSMKSAEALAAQIAAAR